MLETTFSLSSSISWRIVLCLWFFYFGEFWTIYYNWIFQYHVTMFTSRSFLLNWEIIYIIQLLGHWRSIKSRNVLIIIFIDSQMNRVKLDYGDIVLWEPVHRWNTTQRRTFMLSCADVSTIRGFPWARVEGRGLILEAKATGTRYWTRNFRFLG